MASKIIIIVILTVVVFLLIGWIIMALLLPLLIVYYLTYPSEKMAEFRGGLARFNSVCFLGMCIYSFTWGLIFRYSPGLKHRNFHDLPIWKWFWVVLGVICFFGCCSMVVVANRYLNRRFRNLTGLASCGFFLAAVLSVIRLAPVLKQPTILGLQASKWLLVILLVLLAHNAIPILTSLAAAWLRIHYQRNNDPSGGRPSQKRQPRNIYEAAIRVILSYLLPGKETREWRRLHVVYFAQGLSRSIIFILTSLLFLLTWILYFGSRLNRTSASTREVYDYVTSTLVCIFIISICWLVKDAIVLYWASRVVYDRFHVEISQRSTQLWLLGILAGREFDILGIDWNDRHEGLDQEGDGKDHWEIDVMDDNNGKEPKTPMVNSNHEAQGEKISSNTKTWDALIRATMGQRLRRDEEARQVLVPSAGQKDRLPIHNIEGMAEYFLAAEGSLSKKSYVSDFCKKWDLINGRSNIHDNKPPIMDLDEKEIEGETVKVLRSEIQNNAFDNWIKKAHKSSLDLARSLSGAKEGVDSLNLIIAWLVIVVAVVIWLPAKRIVTLRDIVLVVSPVLTSSFIFGDACKTLFIGFMFAYVRHPLTVGDRCTINGSTEIMRVMRIGIWDTIFSETSSKVEVIYPNLVLDSSAINKLKDIDPDHDDEETPPEGRVSELRKAGEAKGITIKTGASATRAPVETSDPPNAGCTKVEIVEFLLFCMDEILSDGEMVKVHVGVEIVGYNNSVALIDRVCVADIDSQEKMSQTAILAYIKCLADMARRRDVLDMFQFVDPQWLNHTDAVKTGQSLEYLVSRIENARKDKLVLVPHLANMHWVLYVYHPTDNIVYVFDSLPMKNDENFAISRAEGKALMERAIDGAKEMLREQGINSPKIVSFERVEAPKQANSKDCGYYVCWNMLQLVKRQSMDINVKNFSPRNMSLSQEQVDVVRYQWGKSVFQSLYQVGGLLEVLDNSFDSSTDME